MSQFNQFGPVIPILIIILFWALLFVFAFWFSTRAITAPIDDEHAEQTHEAAEQIEHDEARAGVDDHAPAKSTP